MKNITNGDPKKLTMAPGWLRVFNGVLLPHLLDSPNNSFAGFDGTTTVLEDEPVQVTNFNAGIDYLPEKAKNLVEYQHIETSFHRITSNFCPLVNVFFCPMGVSRKRRQGTDPVTKAKENDPMHYTFGLVPYLVPEINHRQKNPSLVSDLMEDTLMSEKPSDHFRGEYTTLPFRMGASSDPVFANLPKCPLKNWDTLGESKLVGDPTALLLESQGEATEPSDTLSLLFQALQGKENKETPALSVDAFSLSMSARSMETRFKDATKERDHPVHGRLQSFGMHTMTKKLLNRQILKFSSETSSICGIFSNLSALMKQNLPFLRPFFPYEMTSDSIYPFHHSRVLLSALTDNRSSMLEGNHRSFVTVDGLLGGLLGGNATQMGIKKLNSGLLLQPAKVTDVLPCLPDKNNSEMNEVVRVYAWYYWFFQICVFTKHEFCFPNLKVLKACRDYSQILQERLGHYGETTARDLFIKTLQSVDESIFSSEHPFLMSAQVPLLFLTVEDMMDFYTVDEEHRSPSKSHRVIQDLLNQTEDHTITENLRVHDNFKKLFLVEVPKKSKKKKPTDEEEESPPWKVMAINVFHQQKFYRWMDIIFSLLQNDSETVRSLIDETLQGFKQNEDQLPRTQKVEMCVARILKNLFVRGTITSVKSGDLKHGAYGGLYVLGGIFCDFVRTREDKEELSKFFLSLPAGVGSYEKLYSKGTWKNPAPERLPLKESAMDMSSIHFLGKLFFLLTNSMAEAIRLRVNYQIMRRGDAGGKKTSGNLAKKVVFPIIFRHVATSWLKILNRLGIVIHPTEHMKEHLPGKKLT